jgi:hypothetical protein
VSSPNAVVSLRMLGSFMVEPGAGRTLATQGWPPASAMVRFCGLQDGIVL